MNLQPRVEPRWISLADLMVAVAGCAVGYSLQPFSLGWVRVGDVYGTGSFWYNSLFWTARGPILILALAVAAAILVRQARYERMPHPAEWPALVFAASLVSTAVLHYAYALTLTGRSEPPVWRPDRWPWAAAWSLSALVGLILLMALRRQTPAWLRTFGIASLATMWLCGPAHVYFKQATGPNPHTVGSTATWAFQLRWSAWADRGRWPELLLFAVAIAAALRDDTRRGRAAWSWTERSSLGLALLLAVCWWLDRISPIDRTNPARLANLVVRTLWLCGLGLVSWVIVRGCDLGLARMTETSNFWFIRQKRALHATDAPKGPQQISPGQRPGTKTKS